MEEDLIIPPVTWATLEVGGSMPPVTTTELSILELYLYTYNVGPDSSSGVLLIRDIHVAGINVGL